MHKRLGATLLLAGWVVGHAAVAVASDSQAERETLTGLTPISVVVEDLSAAAQKAGLSVATLQTNAEQRVRRAGITMTPDADAYLYVHVTVADPGTAGPLPYVVEVTLMQEVTLPRGLKTRTPIQAPTWGLSRLGLVSPDALRAAITDRVGELVDQFVRAYQSVNPPPAPR